VRGAELLDKMGLTDTAYVIAAHAPPKQGVRWHRLGAVVAACLVLAVISATLWVQTQNNSPGLPRLEPTAAAPPGGMRRMMNYDGIRYIFLEDGAAFSLSLEQIGDAAGVLEYDIQADPETNAKREFSTTYALGGTVRLLTDYDPAFRVAVELDGTYYICQSVGHTDNSDMDASKYFQQARFSEIVEGISIYDHMGRDLLSEVPTKDVASLVEILSQTTPAKLDNDDYQQIAKAQKNGLSYRLSFNLSDGTKYWLYVIPSLDIAMLGDGRYTLPDSFSNQFGTLFDGLEQKPLLPEPS